MLKKFCKLTLIGLMVLGIMGGVVPPAQSAQLVFNQVLSLSATTNATWVTVGTVPAGRAWKITAAGGYGQFAFQTTQTTAVDGAFPCARSDGGATPTIGPVWLGAGEVLYARSIDTTSRTFVFSIVEYLVQ